MVRARRRVEVHEGEGARARNEVLAEVGFELNAFGISAVRDAFGFGDEPFVGADEEAAGAAGRIGDGEVGFAGRVGFHDAADGLDEWARGEVLSGAFLAFAGGFFEEAFEGGAFDIDIHGRPILFVDHGDEALEVDDEEGVISRAVDGGEFFDGDLIEGGEVEIFAVRADFPGRGNGTEARLSHALLAGFPFQLVHGLAME